MPSKPAPGQPWSSSGSAPVEVYDQETEGFSQGNSNIGPKGATIDDDSYELPDTGVTKNQPYTVSSPRFKQAGK